MTTTALGLDKRSYVLEALLDQHNVIVVLGAGALSLSFASIWPLAVALVAECLWLLAGSRSARFRALVDRRAEDAERSRRVAEHKPFVDKLDVRTASRFSSLEESLRAVLDAAEERGATSSELDALRTALDRLTRAFLDFGVLHARLSRAAAEVPFEELQAELTRAAELFAVERNLETRVALRQEQKAIQRRLLQRDNLLQAEHAAGAKLGAVENGVAYLRSRALVSVAAAQLANEADVLFGQIGSPRSLEGVLGEERAPDSRNPRRS